MVDAGQVELRYSWVRKRFLGGKELSGFLFVADEVFEKAMGRMSEKYSSLSSSSDSGCGRVWRVAGAAEEEATDGG